MNVTRRQLLSGTAFGLSFVLFAAHFQFALDTFLNRVRSFFGIKPKERVLWLGFSGDVPANNVASIASTPQHAFYPKKMIVPASIASHFELEAMHIDDEPQTPSDTPLPCEMFLPGSVYGDVDFSSARMNRPIVLRVRNLSNRPRRFHAALSGIALIEA